jgi:hypothetical protein
MWLFILLVISSLTKNVNGSGVETLSTVLDFAKTDQKLEQNEGHVERSRDTFNSSRLRSN